MFGEDLILYAHTDVVNLIGRDVQGLWCVEKEKNPSKVPLYQARLPVYSWMSGPVSTNMYQFDQHTVWIGTTSGWDNKVYLSLSLFLTPLSARALACCSTSYASFPPLHLQFCNYVTYSAGHVEEIQDNNLGGFMPLIHLLLYLDKFVADNGNIDAGVVVYETPATAAKIVMSDTRTKVVFLAVSAFSQKDLSSAVGGALQDAIVERYMLDTDQMEEGVTGANGDTQEHWLLLGTPDSDRGQQGHQKLHAGEAAHEQEVSEAPVPAIESTVPTLPKMKKTAQIVPTRSTAVRKETPSSGNKKAKERGKESNKADGAEDENAERGGGRRGYGAGNGDTEAEADSYL